MSKVFLSYVKEDAKFVDLLVAVLSKNGVEVWLDREDLMPGQRWQMAIAKAIKNGTYFLSVHSKNRNFRDKSYVNEELVTAIDELRKRPYATQWLIPLKIDDAEIPDRRIGAGENYSDLQYCDFSNWKVACKKLLITLGVETPLVELETPLSDKLPASVRISNGFIRYDRMPMLPDLLQGMEIRVVAGWCQRTEDDKILAYIETSGPNAVYHDINKLIGLTGYHAISNDKYISHDVEHPTKFVFAQDYNIPAGTSLPTFQPGENTTIFSDILIGSALEVYGHVEDDKMVGNFVADLEFKAGPFGLQEIQQTGVFSLDLVVD